MRRFLAGFSLALWFLMWLASQDLWHEAGRPLFMQLDFDLRWFIVMYYLLLPVFVAQFVVAVMHDRKQRS